MWSQHNIVSIHKPLDGIENGNADVNDKSGEGKTGIGGRGK